MTNILPERECLCVSLPPSLGARPFTWLAHYRSWMKDGAFQQPVLLQCMRNDSAYKASRAPVRTLRAFLNINKQCRNTKVLVK